MEDELIKFTCNSDATDEVSFDDCSLTGVLWVSINEAGVSTQVCINKEKMERLRNWLNVRLEAKP